jgi:hypothetical protein
LVSASSRVNFESFVRPPQLFPGLNLDEKRQLQIQTRSMLSLTHACRLYTILNEFAPWLDLQNAPGLKLSLLPQGYVKHHRNHNNTIDETTI